MNLTISHHLTNNENSKSHQNNVTKLISKPVITTTSKLFTVNSMSKL